jgi:DNA-binding FrmR family transcriptional regulator
MATTRARSGTSPVQASSAPAVTADGADSAGCGEDREMMPADKRQEALARLARASGQVQGIQRMVEQGRHCTDVLQQIAAVQKALDGVGTIVLRNYLERCVTTAIESGDPLIYDELMKVFARYR